jgi:cytochrome c peroxidase
MREFDAVGCDRCHEGPMFSDFQLHAEGVVEHPLLATPDTSVALTAPYMYNGTLASLEAVMRFYDEGRSRNPNVADGGRRRGNGGAPSLDRDFRRVASMTPAQMEDIIAFLRALTDDDYDRMIPTRVPSGLTPGGHIQHEGGGP